jgi:hypothetical protein
LKHVNSVRRPNLANSTIKTDKKSSLSIGDTLREAKSNLFFFRCLTAIMTILFVTALIVIVYMGYANPLFNFLSDAVQ